jgi:hypothetical protein
MYFLNFVFDFLFDGAGARQPTYLVTADDVDSVLAIEVQPLDDRKRKVYFCNMCWPFLNGIFFPFLHFLDSVTMTSFASWI